MKIYRAVAVGSVLFAAALGWAGPASAEPLDGAYSITVTDGDGVVDVGTGQGVFATPCGPDCTHFIGPTWSADGHLLGNSWSVTRSGGSTLTFDQNSLAGTIVGGGHVLQVQLTKVA